MCLNPGDILRDRYHIIGQLGEGGFAKTYTANDALGSSGNPLCVVKEIQAPQSNDPDVLHRAQVQFETEAESLISLEECSRIPRLIEHFQEQGKFYLIQEYIAGNPLNKEIGSGRQFRESEVIDLLQDILEVLDCVHKKHIIHRDIKPSNLIRCQRTGKIAVIDFGAVKGISNLAMQGGQITQTRVIGTDGYMPAEQWKNQPRFNSDIYAVGIIAIQAIAGLDIEDFLNHKKTGELVWHYSTDDRPMVQISDKLEKVLNKMVRYHFNDRYQSAAEVLDHLRSEAVSPSPPIEIATQVGVEYSIARDSKTPSPPNLPDGLSAGEKILFTSSQPWLKQKGVKEFAASNSKQAFNTFKESWHNEDGKDPETLIYLNNAFLEVSNAPYYTIAVVLSVCRRNPDSFSQLGEQAKEYLRGVAQAQTEVNLRLSNSSDRDFPGQGFLPSQAIKGKGLKVIIADDANDEEEAKQRAISLVDRPDILAVIGHASSEMTMHAVDIYNNNNLVLMSPGAATGELTHEPRKFFFRTQYTSSLIAKDLAKYLRKQNQTQVAILYNPRSPFGASFVKGYKNYFRRLGGTIVRIQDFDLFKKDFNTARAIKEIQTKGETAIVLVPDPHHSRTLDSAFDIIKLNGSRNWIAGAWMLMCPQMLEFVSGQPQNVFNKLILSVGWHPLNSPNPEFPQQARSLWGEEGNTRIASAYDAARALIKALEMQQEPSRKGMQKMLSSPDFSADGATGTIQFNSPENGDRKNHPSDLVHIVECPNEQFGLAFVPVKYPTAAAAGLKCD
ncbi:serine/threonine protein kinase [Microcoleus vaginatus PCC 9802]|uniref:bifunctional serine/threonine-protein kinase/ABC transporter substrate-binding protein n=1 Tax=Microcoleus vaginatus TaxID=119532 RepID=UPI00020D1468|nr:serine/threonine protein kinase [Microcoleus vaginatus FGP-2]UNU17612.1 serine/threonine protein kinase [Microcoleus vaginatus PCC 9802]